MWNQDSNAAVLGPLAASEFPSRVTSTGPRAFFRYQFNNARVWDSSHGFRDVKAMLIDEYGLSQVAGWTLRMVLDISPDGTTIVGEGLNPQGFTRTWIARLPSPDSDGDGLLNTWESQGQGMDVNGDGTIDLDLYALGARPNRKDLFVEIDSMTGQSPTSLQPVVQAFANAPVTNPDASTGITLHLQVDDTTLPVTNNLNYATVFDALDSLKSIYFGTAAQRGHSTSVNILAAKRKAYRYCLYATTSTGTMLGVARDIPGNDFVIFKGEINGSINWDERATFMHELGHCLNLAHGPTDVTNPENFIALAPNYISVMNLLYCLPFNADDAWRLDYSRGQMLPIIENNIDESIALQSGTGANNGVLTYFGFNSCATNPCDPLTGDLFPVLGYYIGSGPRDFNGDLQITSGVCMDLNFHGTNSVTPGGATPSPCQTINDDNDWALLHYPLVDESQDGGAPVHPPIELTIAQLEHLMKVLPGPPCLPDINGSGTVDVDDLLAVIANWGSCPLLPSLCIGDIAPLPVDGEINVDDLLAVISNWGACP
jgi:hypothetical protein